MIRSFRHKGLKALFEKEQTKGVRQGHVPRLRRMLARLDEAATVDDMDVPGWGLHPLKGEEKGRWSVWVNGNWRMTFEFKDGHAHVLDYEDYH
jgi:toxin HigB-1